MQDIEFKEQTVENSVVSDFTFEYKPECPHCFVPMQICRYTPSCNECESCFCSDQCLNEWHLANKVEHDYNMPIEHGDYA